MKFLQNVELRYYKSISYCSVDLDNLTVLVGPNGSGKSNFLDALSFVSDALNSTLDFAIRQRSGLAAVRKRSGGHPTNFTIKLRVKLPSGATATYAFQVGANTDGSHRVQKERISVAHETELTDIRYENGAVKFSTESFSLPDVGDDRLALQTISGISNIRELYDTLSSMYFYNIYPEDFRLPQSHDTGEYLLPTGKNIASVFRAIAARDGYELGRINSYLQQIVTNLTDVSYKNLGPTETIEFLQKVVGQRHPWRFFAAQMSDGTLRSLGILVALFQKAHYGSRKSEFLGIEEPESTIHPAACAVITDAIIEASRSKQVIITTHSPELIDHPLIDIDSIRIVQSLQGDTAILPADEASKRVLRERLVTAGELLRKNQLMPAKAQPKQLSFWNS